MIKHIVMWRLKERALDNDRETNAHQLKERLEALRGKVPGMLSLEVGLDLSGDPDAAHVVLYSEFEDQDALERYQRHPDHEAVKPFVKEIRSERRVVDYAI